MLSQFALQLKLLMHHAGLYLPVAEALDAHLSTQPAETFLFGALPLPQSGRSISGAQPNLVSEGLTERSLPHPDDYESADNGEYYGSIRPYRHLQVRLFTAITVTAITGITAHASHYWQ